MGADTFINQWIVRPLDDGSYYLEIYYQDENGKMTAKSDRFSFSSSAKLTKFIKRNLLSSGGDKEEEPTE